MAQITEDYTRTKTKYAFPKDGGFGKERDTEFFGSLLNNRRDAPLRALHVEDVVDTHACRNFMKAFFRGKIDIEIIYRVYDAKEMKKYEIVYDDIKTSNKKAKKTQLMKLISTIIWG